MFKLKITWIIVISPAPTHRATQLHNHLPTHKGNALRASDLASRQAICRLARNARKLKYSVTSGRYWHPSAGPFVTHSKKQRNDKQGNDIDK